MKSELVNKIQLPKRGARFTIHFSILSFSSAGRARARVESCFLIDASEIAEEQEIFE